MNELLTQLSALSYPDWLATVTAVAYVLLAARDNNWCWLFAAVSAATWAYVSFFSYRLVSDALLQLFYLLMAGAGIYRWRNKDGITGVPARPVTRMTLREHLLTVTGSLVLGVLLGYFVSSLTTATATYPDAITTVFSVSATFLLIARRVENWLYWVAIDAVYVYIYLGSGALLFALLMVIYVVVAIYGYRNWLRLAVDGSHEAAA